MRYEIYLPQTFQRCIKFLKKKIPHVKDDLSPLLQNLQEDPQIGDSIPDCRPLFMINPIKSS